jgi:hypothetical protein
VPFFSPYIIAVNCFYFSPASFAQRSSSPEACTDPPDLVALEDPPIIFDSFKVFVDLEALEEPKDSVKLLYRTFASLRSLASSNA